MSAEVELSSQKPVYVSNILLGLTSYEGQDSDSLYYDDKSQALSSCSSSDIGDGEMIEIRNNTLKPNAPPLPDMWSKHYVGLYSQYAIVGLLYGMSGTLVPFCSYVYNGDSNTCANARSIATLSWNFKLLYALLTDSIRPWGLRRKPWMVGGLSVCLLLLLALALGAHTMSASSWLGTLVLLQAALMFSDVPADGYSVELGQSEPHERRGQILATGQRVRFSFCVVAGLIQTVMLNGSSTSPPGSSTWGWGLTINGYYGLLLALCSSLYIPVLFLREPDPNDVPRHTLTELMANLWVTMQGLTTHRLVIFVVGYNLTATMINVVNIFLQFYVIKLSSFQAGIDTTSTYLALVAAIYVFQKYLINRNWRLTQYMSTVITSILGLLWIPAYYNAGGTRNAWYTIFVDLDQGFTAGITQVLASMCVIELAQEGQEATTYELLVSINNTTLMLSTVIATQLLYPFDCVGCTTRTDEQTCPEHSVNISNQQSFEATDGPFRFTVYCVTLCLISIGGCLLFTPFLPSGKEECARLKAEGARSGTAGRLRRGMVTLGLAAGTVLYGFIAALLLISPRTSCLPAVGGSGC